MNNTPPSQKSRLRAPSARATAALAAAMLAVGVAVGAAIGPAPSASFAVEQLRPLIPLLAARAHPQSPAATASAPEPAAEPTSRPRRRRKHRASEAASAAATASTPATEEASTPAASAPAAAKPKAAALPPVTKVWLIVLSGSTFAEAASQTAAAPYIDGQATASGTLLGGWSSAAASAFAGDAALLASTPPQVLDTVVQPPCPEGAAGASCAADTPGAVAAANTFLKETLPAITSTAAYRESGLVVVTFGSVAAGAATGLPSGSTTATLTSEPPAGVLLISPFVAAGVKSSVGFEPSSPEQSLEKLLRH